jgi:hypothetical protein
MKAKNIKEAGFRDAVLMDNDKIRVVISSVKGMVPELSMPRGAGRLNAHWQPWFRANSGEEWNESKHASFWGAPLLYDLAGNFPCLPNFGPDNRAGDFDLPPHGHTARLDWKQETPAVGGDQISLISTLDPSDHPFAYTKKDLLVKDHPVHYTALTVKNTGSAPLPFNCGWHNTVGAPFLESGCLIDNNAVRFAVPAQGTEFDPTGRLAFGAEAESMTRMPARNGDVVNMREVTGVTGYADFVTGAVPSDCRMAWSSLVNPRLKGVYLTFFTGPTALQDSEIPLYFYDYWLNFGGRSYTPWATEEGLTDQTFCLGTENGTGRFANGLSDCLENPSLLGHPTYLTLEAGEEKTLYYGTLFASYEGNGLNRGIVSAEPEKGTVRLKGLDGETVGFPCDTEFSLLGR